MVVSKYSNFRMKKEMWEGVEENYKNYRKVGKNRTDKIIYF